MYRWQGGGGQSGSEISYLFLRVVNITSVLLKKLPYGPLGHLPSDEKEPKNENRLLEFSQIPRFSYLANLLELHKCKSPEPQIIWYATIFGSPRQAWRWWTMGVVVHCSGGGKAGQGKMEAAWLDQLPQAPRPSFHTDPVQCCHCSTALLEGLFGRGMSERWLLETTFWRLHSYISQVIQVQWVHSGVKYSREQTEPSSTVFHSWEHTSRKVLPTPSYNVYLTWNKQHVIVHWCMVESLTGTLLTFVGGDGASDHASDFHPFHQFSKGICT